MTELKIENKRKCSKKGCDQIFCNHHSKNFGYICDVCLEDLKSFLLRHDTYKLDMLIKEFLSIDKRCFHDYKIDNRIYIVESYLKNEYKNE